MEPTLTEMEIHSHLTPLTRLGGVRVCVLDGSKVVLDRMKIPSDQLAKMAQTIHSVFLSGRAPRDKVAQLALGFDGGNLIALAYRRLRIGIFMPLGADLDPICRTAYRVVQELGNSYERSGHRRIISRTFGEMHRARGYGQEDPIFVEAHPPKRLPAPFPPRPGRMVECQDSDEPQTTPIRPSSTRLGTQPESH